MALEHIEYGSLASSEMMNGNFEYLDDRISNLAETQASDISGVCSSIAGVNSSLSEQTAALSSDISSLSSYAQAIRRDLNAKNHAPNYARGVGITLPYTASKNGYVYAGVDGIDSVRYVYVNNHVVHGHCGYSGGYRVYSGSLFRVNQGDTVTCSRTYGNYYFYPMKGD